MSGFSKFMPESGKTPKRRVSFSRERDNSDRQRGGYGASDGFAAARNAHRSANDNGTTGKAASGNGKAANDDKVGQSTNQQVKDSEHAQAPPAANPTTTVPGVAPYNNFAPTPTAGNQVFTHYTGSFNHGIPAPLNYNTLGQIQPTSFINGQPIPAAPIVPQPFGLPTFIAPTGAMSGYVQPANMGIHFQPQVPDTTNGPYVHTYHPRHDQMQTVYVPAVGTNPCLQYPPIIQQPVIQQPAVIQQPVMYQAQIPIAASAAHGGVIPAQVQGGHVLTAPATAAFTPMLVAQQPQGQPMMVAAGRGGGQPQYVAQQPVMVNGVPHVVAGNAPFPGQPGIMHPDPVLGIGQTGSEVMADQIKFAHENGLFDAQDFKPKDDDPSRYYMVRELDGTWTQRNRYTIDALNCRWYLADQGYFYAVRVPES
ncbi:hypothetical protein GE09DRAFT_1221560 [Coniochaeta sp. 2T2.1]|nr:hypothetical protein GE09DRAFT_1221560 [Coniochaeta sp. 2T2.1]